MLHRLVLQPNATTAPVPARPAGARAAHRRRTAWPPRAAIGQQAARPKDGTGAFYPFHGPVEVPVKPWGEWNSYELTCIGPNYSLRLNGRLVNTWTDDQKRPLSGYIGLQNYPYKQAVRHRNLRIKELL